MRRLFTALAIILSGLAVAPQLADAKVGDGGCVEHANQTAGLADGVEWQDYQVELDPGADSAHYANWLVGEVGVSEADRAARHIYSYCAVPGYAAVWLRLKSEEVADMDLLVGQRPQGVRGGVLSARVDIPIMGDAVTPADYSLQSPQHVPVGRERIGWTPPSSSGIYASAGVKVAVLDTGIDAFHQDLNVVDGFDCTMEYPDRWMHDPHGHGTHVFGDIGAIDNDVGSVGVAAGVPGISLPVLGSEGWGTMASVACGVDQAYKFRATVANLSLGGTREPEDCGAGSPYVNIFCAATAAGMYVVVAAGNSADDAWSHSPANIEGVITVGAMAPDIAPGQGCAFGTPANSFATFSSYGPFLDVVAPGVCSYSTIPGNRGAVASGTSMATPIPVGVIANFIATRPKECSDSPGKAWRAILTWSTRWMDGEGAYGGWVGPPEDQPPLIRFGAPCALRRM